MAKRDFLDEMVAERTARNPNFPKLLDAARRRRQLLRTLATTRQAQARSQTEVAAAMQTSQSSVARLESAAEDARMSTVDRYAVSVGFAVQYHLIPLEKAGSEPAVVIHDAA